MHAPKKPKANRKVILAGVAADECFGGYDWQSRYKKKYISLNFLIKNYQNLITYSLIQK